MVLAVMIAVVAAAVIMMMMMMMTGRDLQDDDRYDCAKSHS